LVRSLRSSSRRSPGARRRSTGIQAQALFSGRVVATASIATNPRAGTNEDVALGVERSNVILAGGDVTFQTFADVVGLTAPTGY